MKSKDLLMIVFSGMVCTIFGIILIPLLNEVIYQTTNYMAPIWLMILAELVVMIAIIAFHTWVILQDRTMQSDDGPSIIEELRSQLSEIKGE